LVFVAAQAKKPAASGTQFRSITVSAVPSAKVWIDGVYYGKTNASGSLTIMTVATGAHTLRLRADGYKERSQPLAATQRGEVKVDLVKTTDEAELAVQEAERLAFIDREKAIEAYQRAVELRPVFPDAYLALARVLTETGDVEDAVARSRAIVGDGRSRGGHGRDRLGALRGGPVPPGAESHPPRVRRDRAGDRAVLHVRPP